jgi:uncharacterized membrane protein
MNTDIAGPNESSLSVATSGMETNAVEATIIVAARLPRTYRQCLRIQDYPKFIPAIKRVRQVDASHFAVEGEHEGEEFSAILEIMLRVPDRRIAWRLLHDHLTAGVVSFVALSGNRTQINLKMMSSFGGVLAEWVESYLQAFKKLIETEHLAMAKQLPATKR